MLERIWCYKFDDSSEDYVDSIMIDVNKTLMNVHENYCTIAPNSGTNAAKYRFHSKSRRLIN